MTDLTFWATIAKVSATFVGLVFIGISIYFSRIKDAIKEMSSYGFKEPPTIFPFMLSNLIYFIVPFLISIILLSDRTLITFFFLSLIFIISCVISIWNFKSIINILSKGKIFRGFIVGFLLILYVLASGIVAILVVNDISLFTIDLKPFLKILCFVGLFIGISLTVYDIRLFDKDNIVSSIDEKISEKFEKHNMLINIAYKKAQDKKNELLEKLYNKLSAERKNEYVNYISKKTQSKFKQLENDIETVQNTSSLIEEKGFTTYKEFKLLVSRKELREQIEQYLDEIDELLKKINEKKKREKKK